MLAEFALLDLQELFLGANLWLEGSTDIFFDIYLALLNNDLNIFLELFFILIGYVLKTLLLMFWSPPFQLRKEW